MCIRDSFPIVWEDGRHRALPESELPVLQPDLDDFAPTGDPRGPLDVTVKLEFGSSALDWTTREW